MLDKHGFEVVKSRLSGKLAEFGYKSEHVGHDLLAQAFHLGDWALGAPDGFRLFSEQQIRRMDKDDWPAWVPTIRHRPDGWIHNAKTAETFAIEVEISAKHSLKYGGIYSCSGHNRKQLTGVLWLTPSATVARRILKHLIKWEVNGAPHHFFDFESFKKLGWGAQVIVGQNEGMTIREILEQHPQNSPPTSSQHDVTQLCLNMVKTPFRSKGCRLYEIGDFGN